MRLPARPTFGSIAILASVATVVAVSAPAFGEDIAKARKLFTKGLEQEEAGAWSEALATFREVATIRTNHIVRFHIALCLEKTGKLVESIEQFSLAKAQAEKEGGTDAELTVANAKKHLDALRGRVPSLRVSKPAAPGARLSIDGDAASFDAAIPLDPGVHVVVVEAPEHARFEQRVTLVEGVATPAAVEPKLVPVAATAPAPRPSVPVGPDVAAPGRTWSWVLGGVGVASLAGAGVFYGLRASTLNELEAACDANREHCDPSKKGLDDRGRSYTIGGNVLLGVGVVAVGAAITIAVLRPTPQTQVALLTAPSTVSLRVSF